MKSNNIILRSLETRMQIRLFEGKALILIGPRQAGKTTLIENILQQRKEKILRFNADEPDVRELLEKVTSTRLRTLIGESKLLFIDEAQRVPDIGLTLKLITDQIPDVQVIATGSSAFELNARTAEPLTGRKFEFMLYPLSFAELVGNHDLLEEKRMLEHRIIYGSYLISERLKYLNNQDIPANKYFWRTTQQQEIDYIEEVNQKLHAYEFKWNKKKGRVRFPKTFLRNYEDVSTSVITPENYETFLYI